MTRLRWCGLVGAVLLVLAACGGTDSSDASDVDQQDSDLVLTGEPLYQAHCASCHGVDLRGTDKGPSHLSVVYEPSHHSDAAFLVAVRIGSPEHHWRFGDMEPVEGLSDEDVAAITAFVREQQRIQGFEPYPP